MNIPTYDEISRYCAAHQLTVDVPRFYEYYAGYGFLYEGKPIPWQQKAREWHAKRQGIPVLHPAQTPVSAPPEPKKRTLYMPGGPTDDLKLYLTYVAQKFGITPNFSPGP